MDLRDQSVAMACSAIVTPGSTLTAGDNQQGLPLTRIAFPDADVVYSRRFLLGAADEKVELEIADGTFTEEFGIEGAPEGKSYMVVTGTLTDGTDPIIIGGAASYFGESGSKPKYQFGDIETDGYFLAWDTEIDGGENKWALQIIADGIEKATYFSASDVATPDLATGWTPESPATGTPVITAAGFSQSLDPSGKDIYGNDLPTMDEVHAVLVECLSGAADIEVDGNELKSVSAGEKRLCANANGIPTYLDTMEITATAADTDIRVTVIGKSADE